MINTRLELFSETRSVEQSMHFVRGSFRMFIFLVLRLGVWVVQINRHDLLLNFIQELMRSLVLLNPLYIKSILRVI